MGSLLRTIRFEMTVLVKSNTHDHRGSLHGVSLLIERLGPQFQYALL